MSVPENSTCLECSFVQNLTSAESPDIDILGFGNGVLVTGTLSPEMQKEIKSGYQ